MKYIIITFVAFFILRLVSLSFSICNEKRLLSKGGVQHGKLNSLMLTLAHVAYYIAALFEAYKRQVEFNTISLIGTCIMAFAYIILFYVIYKLRDIWTVKLYIVPQQRIERSFLFRTVRHPNYYLNIIPELVGIALLCNAWTTLCIGYPAYLCILFYRIRLEERVMTGLF